MIALLALLSLAAGSGPGAGGSGSLSRASGAPPFFLQDPRDGQCLAGGGFRRCGVDSLWAVSGRAPRYQLHARPSDDVAALDDWCLAK